jgi:phosphotransferase system enzyme I (PtsI)
MITSVSEVKQVQEIVEECRQELEKRRVKYAIPKQGIMIETPAAVMIAEELAEVSDFFSIGTNDLTQYALALDRQNGSLMDFMDPHHPAIVRMIEMAAKGAKAHGIEVGICGEMAMDPSFLQKYAELGLAYMSVNPSNILQIRKNISNMP